MRRGSEIRTRAHSRWLGGSTLSDLTDFARAVLFSPSYANDLAGVNNAMHLDRIRIQGFHSIRDLTFEPEDLSVLVGPNNAGKSNLVRAIEFLSDTYGNGLESALAEHGGIGNVLFRGPTQEDIALQFEIEVSLSGNEALGPEDSNGSLYNMVSTVDSSPLVSIKHKFRVEAIGQGNLAFPTVQNEELEVSTRANDIVQPVLHFFSPKGTSISVRQWQSSNAALPDSFFLRPSLFRTSDAPPTEVNGRAYSEHELPFVYEEPHRRELAIGKLRLFSQILKAFTLQFSTIRLYSFIPVVARQPASPFYLRDLGPDGRNLPTLIYRFQNAEEDSWSEVIRALFEVSPELESVAADFGEDGNLSLRFEERVGETVLRRSATEVSDGTIRSLAMFAALFDPTAPVVAFEEPENSLHPWAIRAFINACRRTIRHGKKQVILTTHSPVVLDSLVPENVFVMWRNRSETMLQRLVEIDPDADRLWREGSATLFDLIDSGWVRAAIPGGVS